MRWTTTGFATALLSALLGLALVSSAQEKKDDGGAPPKAAPVGTIAGLVKGKWVAKFPAAVYLDEIPGKTFPPPAEHAKVNQENLVFSPRVLPILVGTTVDFRNSDPFLHNVFCPDQCAEFNLGTWGKGESKSYTFTKAGCVATLLCRVHPEMIAYIVVCSTPYFAATEKDGSFKIENVPPGKYKLVTWHEKLEAASADVVVEAGATARAEVEPTKKKK